MNKDLAGKIFLVTGGTDGIGKAAVTEFAKRGATITIIGRSKTKTEQAVAELRDTSGNTEIDYILCDLSRLADIRRAADAFRARHDRLDVLVNNAGAMFNGVQKSPDGYELTFALNHLAYFQLTTELLDLIRKTPGARVVSTASGMQRRGKLDLKKTPYGPDSGMGAYAASKLANVLFTKELQRRLNDTTATANCFEPGSVRTKFGAFGGDFGFVLNTIFAIARPFSRTPEQGADSLIWLATSPEAASLKGEYVSNRKPVKPQRLALDPVLAADLWSLSVNLCSQASAAR